METLPNSEIMLLVITPDGGRHIISSCSELKEEITILYEKDKKVEIANTVTSLIENIEKSIQELKMAECTFYFDYSHKEECKSGWYIPAVIGRPKQHIKKQINRIRSKPVTICRYKWKLKKQKKTN